MLPFSDAIAPDTYGRSTALHQQRTSHQRTSQLSSWKIKKMDGKGFASTKKRMGIQRNALSGHSDGGTSTSGNRPRLSMSSSLLSFTMRSGLMSLTMTSKTASRERLLPSCTPHKTHFEAAAQTPCHFQDIQIGKSRKWAGGEAPPSKSTSERSSRVSRRACQPK